MPYQNVKRKAMLSVFLLLTVFQTYAQGFLRADGKKIVNEKGQNVLLRGFGLGGWMLQEGYMLGVNGEGQQYRIRQRVDSLIGPEKTAEFYDAWINNFITKTDIDSLRSWGFNSVRLPMHYQLYTLPIDKEPVTGKNTWLDKGFTLTDKLLSWCKSNGLYLILDLHAAPGGQGNDLNISDRDPSKPSLWQDEANREKMIALWKKLAERYKNEPMIGAYDIINEPNWGFSDLANDKNGTKEKLNEPLRKLMLDITTAIREVDKKHIVIIEGNGWGNNYNGVFPLWDNNMVLSFHKYWNKNDAGSIKSMIDAREKYNVPIWLGETGENSNVWFTEAIHLFEENNMGWAWWPLKKLGVNNPLQIRTNNNYQQVLNYWSGRGPKPSAEIAYAGLMQLATDAKNTNNFFHKDVVDAMIRQPFSHTALPFLKRLARDSVKAVDYDLGRNGVAYFDNDTADYRIAGQRGTGNRGRIYRNDGVDIKPDSSGYYVSDFEKGEWLQYTIDIPQNGEYDFKVLVMIEKLDGGLSFSVNGSERIENNSSPGDGWWGKWVRLRIGRVRLNKGVQTLRIFSNGEGYNLKSVSWKRVD